MDKPLPLWSPLFCHSKHSKITSLCFSSSSSSQYICNYLLLFLSFLALMETSLPLATDSFSYSWLSSSKPPLDALADLPLRLSIYTSYQNFNFDVSNLQSPPVLAHADELFSDGLIRPVFGHPLKVESYNCTPDSAHAMSTSSPFSSTTVPTGTAGINHGFLRRWRRSTRQNLRDLFRHLTWFRRKLGWSRKNTRVGDIDKEEWEASPKSVGAYCDHDNSIYEAVLHCKRSFEK